MYSCVFPRLDLELPHPNQAWLISGAPGRDGSRDSVQGGEAREGGGEEGRRYRGVWEKTRQGLQGEPLKNSG